MGTVDMIAVRKCKKCKIVVNGDSETQVILCAEHRVNPATTQIRNMMGKANGRNR